MDKEELVEFVKLFKEVTSEENESEPVKTVKVEDEVKKKKKKKKKSRFDVFEDRLFTLLILLFALLYFYLLATGQTILLHRELQKFKKSQKIIHYYFLKFFNAKYEVEDADYMAEKLKYDQYLANVQLDWSLVSESDFTCSNDLMMQTAELIAEQFKLIEEFSSKLEIKSQTRSVEMMPIDTFSFGRFYEFKSIFNPITIDPFKSNNNEYIDEVTKRINGMYSGQIRNYFKAKLSKESENTALLLSSKQQLLFLQRLWNQTQKLKNVPKDVEALLKTFKNYLHSLLTAKEAAVTEYETKVKTALDDLKTAIESVPICPKKEMRLAPTETEEEEGAEKEKEMEMYYKQRNYMKFFETLYIKQQ